MGDGLGSTSLESHCRPQNRFKILNTLYTPKLKDGVGTIPGVRKQVMQSLTSNVIVPAFQLKLWIYRWLSEKISVRFGAPDFLYRFFIFMWSSNQPDFSAPKVIRFLIEYTEKLNSGNVVL